MKAIKVLREMRELLATQDNLSTAEPVFVVQERRWDCGYDLDYCDNVAWVDGEGGEPVTAVNNAALFSKLESWHRGELAALDGDEEGREEFWTRTGYVERWEFVQPFLTRAAAEEFRATQAHNLGVTRIYVESAYRNPEWRTLRSLLGGELLMLIDRAIAAESKGEP
jgi:hypothetical protein